jgi:hypothetical protein
MPFCWQTRTARVVLTHSRALSDPRVIDTEWSTPLLCPGQVGQRRFLVDNLGAEARVAAEKLATDCQADMPMPMITTRNCAHRVPERNDPWRP